MVSSHSRLSVNCESIPWKGKQSSIPDIHTVKSSCQSYSRKALFIDISGLRFYILKAEIKTFSFSIQILSPATVLSLHRPHRKASAAKKRCPLKWGMYIPLDKSSKDSILPIFLPNISPPLFPSTDSGICALPCDIIRISPACRLQCRSVRKVL